MGNMRFKVGDRVRIKSLDWYNENKNKNGDVYFEGGRVKPCFSHCMSIYCGQIMTISDAIGQLYDMIEDDGRFCWDDEMIEGLVEEEIIDLTSIVMETIEEKTIQNTLTYGYNLPEGYQFVDENGNVINTTKIVLEKKNLIREEQIDNAAQEYIDSDKAVLTYSDGFCEQTDHPFVRAAFKAGVEWADNNVTQDDCSKAPKLTSQDYSNGRFGYRLPAGFEAKLTERELILTPEKKEYPKTLGECRAILGIMFEYGAFHYKTELITTFMSLLICRDAYWKIAGKEMGLGKPLEPDWTNEHQVKYTIYTMGNDVIRHVGNYIHAILAFPTEEMRDAFYENFKELINECKELL